MKTFALALCALLLAVGAVPMALAQDTSNQSPAAAPGANAPSPSTEAAPKAPDVKAPDTNLKIDVQTRTETKGSDDSAAASPRTSDVQRTGFFGLSPAAAIIVSVAVLLVVVLAIVAMTNSGGTTYIDNHDRRV
jgi:hypothetical protein